MRIGFEWQTSRSWPKALVARVQKRLMGLRVGRGHWPAAVTVRLANNAAMKRLNADFRGMDRATDVLSFPAFSPQELPRVLANAARQPKVTPLELGDIILSYQYISKKMAGKAAAIEKFTVYLILHAILHLLGHEHDSDPGYARMRAAERRLLRQLGLPPLP